MSSAPSFRVSTGEIVSLEEAKAFPWEAPVPVEPFWDSFKYCTARNFLDNFSEPELAALPIPHNKANGYREKVGLLLALHRAQLTREEAAASPPQSLYETNHKGLYKLAEQTVRMLVERRPDKNNVVPPHMLAEDLLKTGRYKEAEDTGRPVCAWMDARPSLGKESPQAINARRRAEVGALMGGGKCSVYQKEQRSLSEYMRAELQKGA
ncbi:hypothetical protein GQ53DRAFT_779458 [Thozetella sp. PMI_491]|nr:hypothetical protein GQ53DRAFT_779458 [Thozetella sp. PMI_491]